MKGQRDVRDSAFVAVAAALHFVPIEIGWHKRIPGSGILQSIYGSISLCGVLGRVTVNKKQRSNV